MERREHEEIRLLVEPRVAAPQALEELVGELDFRHGRETYGGTCGAPALRDSPALVRSTDAGQFRVEREGSAQLLHLTEHALADRLVVRGLEDLADPCGDHPELGFGQAAARERRRPDAEPGRDERCSCSP